MNELVITVGIPACGKSTWARRWQQEDVENRVVTERDLFRKEFFDHDKCDGVLPKRDEAWITERQEELIYDRLTEGFSVCVADTNLWIGAESRFKRIADRAGATFSVKRFNTPLSVCLERNSKRPVQDRVPDAVIRRMYKNLNRVNKVKMRKFSSVPLNTDSEKLPAFVFDLDGTVQKMNGRSPYDSMRSMTDLPNVSVIAVIRGLMVAYPDAHFLAVSGREDKAADVTLEALSDYGIAPDAIFMRKTGDFRKDSIIKEEIYRERIEPDFNVIAVFDDRNQTVETWRKLGLHCFQVAEGDF